MGLIRWIFGSPKNSSYEASDAHKTRREEPTRPSWEESYREGVNDWFDQYRKNTGA